MLFKSLEADEELSNTIKAEQVRQSQTINLIASENIASKAVLQAYATCFTNKYAEGNVGKRFYEGCEVVDKMEQLCIQRVCKLFGAKYANVQPHSGSQANTAVLHALLNPKDTILGMDLGSGGHLTHGFRLNFSGKYYNSVQYTVDAKTCLLDYDQIYNLAQKHVPKLIIAGASSYSRTISWDKMKRIADDVGAKLLVDMAHVAGLVAGGIVESPISYADVVTSTTHKTLRGPRGGLILTNDEVLYKKINSALMPGVQGGPLLHSIASKAVCFKDCDTDAFRKYTQQVHKNAKKLCECFMKQGIKVIGGGTDNHMMVLDVRDFGITGKEAANMLAECGIVTNYNAIPFDKLPITQTSGIRLGSACITSCGFEEKDCENLANLIIDILKKQQIDQSVLISLMQKVTKTYQGIFGDKYYL